MRAFSFLQLCISFHLFSDFARERVLLQFQLAEFQDTSKPDCPSTASIPIIHILDNSEAFNVGILQHPTARVLLKCKLLQISFFKT
jgi:hypothetical protein